MEKEQARIKQETGGNGDVYKLLLDLRNFIHKHLG